MSVAPIDASEISPQRPTSTGIVWTVRALSLIALAISGYLAWLAITGQTAAGCGQEGLACERVLSSRWSYVLNVPVSIPAISLWLTALCVSLFATQSRLPALRRSSWMLLTLLTTAAAGAAGWFIGLQAFKLHHWCLYCLAAHGCAIGAWALVLSSRELTSSSKSSALVAGLILAAMLPLAQKWFPRESYYALHRVPEQTAGEPLIIVGERSDPGSHVDVLGGQGRVYLGQLPRIGDDGAEYVIVSLYDYACAHCRVLHGELLEVQRHYNGRLTIVMLPTPLSHHCNRYLTEKQSTSPDACALAKYALIVAHARPESFLEYDEWLFASEEPRTASAARAKAAELLGEQALAEAELDPAYDRQLQQHIELYHNSPAKLLPQIMSRNVILSEGVESTGELLNALEQEFGLQP